MIRLACFSDTHGHPPAPMDEADILACLHAGDLIDGPNAAASVDAVRPWMLARKIPLHFVRGNHDCALPGADFGEMDMTGRVVRLGGDSDGLWLAGVGWSLRLGYDVPGEADLEPVCRMVERQALRLVMPSDRLILLTHYPPDFPGLFEPAVPSSGHVYRCVRLLVEQLRPVAVVQGHVHQWFGKTATIDLAGRPCLIVNPGPRGAVVDDASGYFSSARNPACSKW